MSARSLFMLVWGGLLMITILVVIMAWTQDDRPDPTQAGTPETWSAATRDYVAKQHQLASDYLDKLNTQGARQIIRELLERYPGDYEGHNLLARTFMAEQRWQVAYDAFVRSLSIKSDQPDSQSVAGVIAEKHLRKLEAARDHYRVAARLAPDNPKHALYLANVCVKLNDLDTARMAALEALKLDESIAQAHVILANVAARQGKLPMAIESIERARAMTQPGDRLYLAYLLRHAEFLRRSGPTGGEQALAMLTNLDPAYRNQRAATEQLALTHRSLAQFEQAALVWGQWFSSHPTDVAAAAEAGLALAKAGKIDDARVYLKRAQTLKAHHPLVQALEQEVNQ
jgi:Tfp pilus assembly protein PilF